MFRNFNKLIPCKNIVKDIVIYKNLNNIKSNEMKLNEILNKIPIAERWECRDFKIKSNLSAIQSYSLIVPNEKHYKK